MSRPSIAVVDDEPTFLALMEDLLADEGYRAIPRSTDEGIAELLRSEHPALLILDPWMDGPESGWQTLLRLRHDPATARLPVIVCSTDDRFLARHNTELRTLGCAVMEKPFDLDEMLATITVLIESNAMN